MHGQYLHPLVIVGVYNTAYHRGLNYKEYPLLGLLVENSDLLHDIWRFINDYQHLIIKYDRLHKLYSEDLGLWNRRDLLAGDLLDRLYQRYNLPNYGTRKYSCSSIASGPGNNGTQIFYQPLLLIFFLTKGYCIPLNSLKWYYDPQSPIPIFQGITRHFLSTSVV